MAYYINVRNIHQLTIFLKKSQIISKNISSLLMYIRHIIYVSKKDTSRGTNSGKLGIFSKSFNPLWRLGLVGDSTRLGIERMSFCVSKVRFVRLSLVSLGPGGP